MQIRNVRAVWTAVIMAAFVGVASGNGNALARHSALSVSAARATKVASAGLVSLHLDASPYYVDVNSNIIFRLISPRWPGATTVSLSFLSPHHRSTSPIARAPMTPAGPLKLVLLAATNRSETLRRDTG